MSDHIGVLWGYARVSTTGHGQTHDLQIDTLREAGVLERRIFADTISGSKAAATRPEFSRLLDRIEPGDTVVVWRIDRLGRSLLDVVQTVDDLLARGIQVRSLSDNIDPSTPTGRLMLGLFATLAQYERELIRERVQAGVDAAKARGARMGRPPLPAEDAARRLKAVDALVQGGERLRDAIDAVGWSRASYYRARLASESQKALDETAASETDI